MKRARAAHGDRPAATPEGLQEGRVIAGHGRHHSVETAEGRLVLCTSRGKRNEAVVGDRVRWRPTQDGPAGAAEGPEGEVAQGVIEAVAPRRNLFFRQDELRTKSFAANLDHLLVWIAVEPVFSEMQLTRALIAAEAARIPVTLVLNKTELPGADTARARLAPYAAMGYRVIDGALKPRDPARAAGEAEALLARLRPLLGGATLVLGPSGSGKSTLINALLPEAEVLTGEISTALNSGRHTTTHTRWHWLDRVPGTLDGAALIDSPGFQEFGLRHLAPEDLAACMPDLRQAAEAGCRFHNCSHRHEPGCAVRAALAAGRISPLRHALYQSLREELEAPPRY